MGEAGLQEAAWNTTLLQTRKQSALWPRDLLEPPTLHKHGRSRPARGSLEHHITTNKKTKRTVAPGPPRAPDPAQTWEKQACKRQPGTPHYHKQENKAHCGLLELPTLHKHGRSRPARGSLEHHITTNKKTKRTVAPGPPRAPDPAQTWEKQACKRQAGNNAFPNKKTKRTVAPGPPRAPDPAQTWEKQACKRQAGNNAFPNKKTKRTVARGPPRLPTLG
ncbi:hypothetical protein NDU88_001028 [Pleurodeles waltl]|uniref:Uncharacterized protein n=1 Tax=Pleurodeles waltl TaxID=8319 RepID=A0AAV7WL51_PLEWA|nr:hypothetical protein NDU88_001028 [Pleurodeles waltl]